MYNVAVLIFFYSLISKGICYEETGKEIIYMGDLEKRKEVYGICGECNEPGTGQHWCNAKRSKDNFKNWTSGNKHIDEFIQLLQYSQLNAVHHIPFESFQ